MAVVLQATSGEMLTPEILLVVLNLHLPVGHGDMPGYAALGFSKAVPPMAGRPAWRGAGRRNMPNLERTEIVSAAAIRLR